MKKKLSLEVENSFQTGSFFMEFMVQYESKFFASALGSAPLLTLI